MSIAAETLNKGIRRVVLTQVALSLLVAAGFFLLEAGENGVRDVLSALYGGGIAVLSTWWLGRRVQRAGAVAETNLAHAQLVLYAGTIQRLIGAVVLLGVGFGLLGLRPIPLVAAFAAAQLGFFVHVGGTPER